MNCFRDYKYGKCDWIQNSYKTDLVQFTKPILNIL